MLAAHTHTTTLHINYTVASSTFGPKQFLNTFNPDQTWCPQVIGPSGHVIFSSVEPKTEKVSPFMASRGLRYPGPHPEQLAERNGKDCEGTTEVKGYIVEGRHGPSHC